MNDTQYIGMAVNQLRKNKRMTLQTLSGATGLSQGFLSKFERGQATIAVDSLMQIAAALGTSLGRLLARSGGATQQPEVKIVHRSYENVMMYMENSYHINYQISDNYWGMDVFPKLIVLLPTQEAAHDALFSHHGQEFIYVLEGILTLKINSDLYDLYPGDTAHFKSDVMHTWYNATNRNTTVLTIHTPNVVAPEQDSAQDAAETSGHPDY